MNNITNSEEGRKWQENLCQHPENADKCPWNVLDGND